VRQWDVLAGRNAASIRNVQLLGIKSERFELLIPLGGRITKSLYASAAGKATLDRSFDKRHYDRTAGYVSSTLPRNGQHNRLLTPMDRFYLHIICASVVLLVTAFALGTLGLKSEVPSEKIPVLRVLTR
jgi:hypothetical protein